MALAGLLRLRRVGRFTTKAGTLGLLAFEARYPDQHVVIISLVKRGRFTGQGYCRCDGKASA
jgi:hypothetical protein